MCYTYFGNQYLSYSIDRIATEVDLNRKIFQVSIVSTTLLKSLMFDSQKVPLILSTHWSV